MSSASTQDQNYKEVFGEGHVWSNLESDFQFVSKPWDESLGSCGYYSYSEPSSDLGLDATSEERTRSLPYELRVGGEAEGYGYEIGRGPGEEGLFGSSRESLATSESLKYEKVAQDAQRRSIFVHSCPSHFSDVNRARKSVFGSIFLRTTSRPADESTLLKSLTDSNYSMLQSLLNSFERILSVVPPDSEKKQMMLAYKDSILRMLENYGIGKKYSDGSVHWDIYPIAQSYLFSIQVEDHIHQTRNLSKIEERIISGTVQSSRTPYEWPTNSVWSGYWDGLGMSGYGTYMMPHGVTYFGKMKDGMFDEDNATLTYPNKFRAINCVYEKGELKKCQFQFPDYLLHENENWDYCQFPDRRFWSEVRKGFKPAKIAQKTELDPPRKIPTGCYDTNDGFYNPKTFALLSPTGEMLRVPLYEESMWIRKYCRKGFLEPTNFRPDLFENWYNYDTEFINEILQKHEEFRTGKISYDEVLQFYADHDMMSPCSKYVKRRRQSEVDRENYMKTIPEPVGLVRRQAVKKYHGHKLSHHAAEEDGGYFLPKKKESMASSYKSLLLKKSKSFIKFNEESRRRSATKVVSKFSKINFKLSSESLQQGTTTSAVTDARKEESGKRTIPKEYLKPQPIQRFPVRERPLVKTAKLKKCWKDDNFDYNYESQVPMNESEMKQLQKKRLQKYMKDLIMDCAMKALMEEREKQRNRLLWATKVPSKKKKASLNQNQKCMATLRQLFESIPEKEEFADSDPSKMCDLSKLAEDKYNVLKYWGKRFFTLNFDD